MGPDAKDSKKNCKKTCALNTIEENTIYYENNNLYIKINCNYKIKETSKYIFFLFL